MKYLEPEQKALALRRVQEPWYTVSITLDQEYHFTTGPENTVGGITYVPGYIGALSIDTRGAVIQIFNENWKHTMAAMYGVYKNQAVVINKADVPEVLYVDEDGEYYVDEIGTRYVASYGISGIPLLAGAISTVSPYGPWLTVTAERNSGKRYPSKRILPPFANFTRPEGTIIPVNGSIYRIQSRARLP